MKIELEHVLPADIERRSFEIITEILGDRVLDPQHAPVIKRVIHTTADFNYADNLVFSPDVIAGAHAAIRAGTPIVTDTQMAKAGINQKALARFGVQVHCFMSDEDVAQAARQNGSTRAAASMDKAAALGKPAIFAVGNAPTALVRLFELYQQGKINPAMIIGVPVGFVNVVESKEMILQTDIPHIVARGRCGGSNVAAAIVNALVYSLA